MQWDWQDGLHDFNLLQMEVAFHCWRIWLAPKLHYWDMFKLPIMFWMLSFNEVHMTKENTNILGLVWIEGKWRGVKGNRVELVENRLILGQRSTQLPLIPNGSLLFYNFLVIMFYSTTFSCLVEYSLLCIWRSCVALGFVWKWAICWKSIPYLKFGVLS